MVKIDQDLILAARMAFEMRRSPSEYRPWAEIADVLGVSTGLAKLLRQTGHICHRPEMERRMIELGIPERWQQERKSQS